MRINFSIIILGLLVLSCSEANLNDFEVIRGETMGTTYSIKYLPAGLLINQADIDKELLDLNAALSTYQENSVISKFNKSAHGISHSDISERKLANLFFDNVKIAKVVHELTDGFFEPTVMPLVNYWGFGFEKRIERETIDSARVDSIAARVGFDNLVFLDGTLPSLSKNDSTLQLDFSAVAKGYAVDHLSNYLIKKRIQNFFIDIGGENRVLGVNAEGNPWRCGISTPDEQAAVTSFDFIVELKDQSIATSGNYRNFYEVNGNFISHTINPKTGYFERNDLLSVSILSKNCAYADACATACMAMGMERAKAFISSVSDIQGILIYRGSSGKTEYHYSPELEGAIQRLK